jgi:hypothetical protein
MNQDEKRQMETFLVKQDWPQLDIDGTPSGELMLFFASILNTHKPYEDHYGEWIDQHKMMRNLINECDADKRLRLYTDLTPHLNFKAHALSVYEDMIAEKAGKLLSQRRMQVVGDAPRPIEVGGVTYLAAPKHVATKAAATVKCHRCARKEHFIGDTPAAAMIEARKAGWTREKGIEKECCPDCSIRNAEEIVRLSNKESLVITDRRVKCDA